MGKGRHVPNPEEHRNPDGTYDGSGILSDLSGISREEIQWTWERMKHLRQVEGKSAEEAKAIVKDEAKARPWEQAT